MGTLFSFSVTVATHLCLLSVKAQGHATIGAYLAWRGDHFDLECRHL